MAGDVALNRYFERVGFAGSIAPSLATLQEILAQQAATIPVESLAAILGESRPLDLAALEQTLVSNRRGGTGIEVNALLLAVLRDLDFDATPLPASRLVGRDPTDGVAPLDHMVLRVAVGADILIVDAGLGALTPTAPLRIDPWLEQPTRHEPCRLVEAGNGTFDIELLRPSGWIKLSRVWLDALDPETLAERQAALSGPESPLRGDLVVGLAAPGARREIRDGRAISYPADGEAVATDIADLTDLRDRLQRDFGIVLPAGEAVDARLAPYLRVDAASPEPSATDAPDPQPQA